MPKLSGVRPLALELEGEALAAEELFQSSACTLERWAFKPGVNDRSRRVGKYPRYLLYQRHRLPLLSQQ